MFIIMILYVFLYFIVCIINYKIFNDFYFIKYKFKLLYFYLLYNCYILV